MFSCCNCYSREDELEIASPSSPREPEPESSHPPRISTQPRSPHKKQRSRKKDGKFANSPSTATSSPSPPSPPSPPTREPLPVNDGHFHNPEQKPLPKKPDEILTQRIVNSENGDHNTTEPCLESDTVTVVAREENIVHKPVRVEPPESHAEKNVQNPAVHRKPVCLPVGALESENRFPSLIEANDYKASTPKSPTFSKRLVRELVNPPRIPHPPKCVLSEAEVENHPLLIWLQYTFEPSPQSATAAPMTDEEKKIEKERLSKLVKRFAKDAVAGVECTFFDHGTGQKFRAEYTLDRMVKTFGISVEGKQYAFLMSNLHEVYTWGEMMKTPKLANFLKMRGFSEMGSGDRERLVMLEYLDEKDYLQRICILIDKGNPESADDLLKCMKILRLFSVTPSPR